MSVIFKIQFVLQITQHLIYCIINFFVLYHIYFAIHEVFIFKFYKMFSTKAQTNNLHDALSSRIKEPKQTGLRNFPIALNYGWKILKSILLYTLNSTHKNFIIITSVFFQSMINFYSWPKDGNNFE